jgi:hypothetical protein
MEMTGKRNQLVVMKTRAAAPDHHQQLTRIDAMLRQWVAWKRKQTPVRPALTREYLEDLRQQLLDEYNTMAEPPLMEQAA